jgi:hypothetical protein
MPFDKSAPGFLDRRPIQVSKPLAECDEVVIVKSLPTEEENRVVQPGSVDAREIIRFDRAQIDSLNFRSQDFSCWDDGDARLFCCPC